MLICLLALLSTMTFIKDFVLYPSQKFRAKMGFLYCVELMDVPSLSSLSSSGGEEKYPFSRWSELWAGSGSCMSRERAHARGWRDRVAVFFIDVGGMGGRVGTLIVSQLVSCFMSFIMSFSVSS